MCAYLTVSTLTTGAAANPLAASAFSYASQTPRDVVMYGAVLSGVDTRPRWFVLMAGTTTFSEWYLLGKKPADVPAYVAQMAPLDPLAYLARSKAEAYLFQFSQKDEYITPEKELQLFGAAPLPKALYLYDADHSLRIPQASSDRLSWLLRYLVPQA